MNDASPAGRGSRRLPGGRHSQGNSPEGLQAFASRLELVPRLQAIVDELDLLDADTDVPHTLALGLLEDVERELAAESAPADRRRS
jgi:hypothetical protein